ncbi:hypothetical protein BGZ65_011825 [Modicella reniformis]|uniref:Survival Motor Neuron Gemin2-binding domain-containing protein n=1 Tax=Modicella reniformis TaxID=1440133 RepID=A0A9P6MAK1_9FUNG|nr:hypothetical protein BGZ65_011825 [Modicella reniformis]
MKLGDHDVLDCDENGQEYYDDEDEDEDEDDGYDVEDEYQENHDDGGDAEIGEKIELSHQEIWDDSELIEAWDMAVKQYKAYHSKTKSSAKTTTISSETTKRKGKAEQASESSSTSKRAKLANGVQHNISEKDEEPTLLTTTTIAPESADMSTQGQGQGPSQSSQGLSSSSSTSDYAVTDRKPSFKKADKPSFTHLQQSRFEEVATATNAKNGSIRTRANTASRPQKNKSGVSPAVSTATTTATTTGSVTAKAVPTTNAAVPPSTRFPVDAATIAYYQQLGQLPTSGIDDEALSNLIMAWYFSGYYTGLYQAQRR